MYIKDTDIAKIRFKDAQLQNTLNNIKDIMLGKNVIYALPVENIKEKMVIEFQNEMNENITNVDKFEEIKLSDLENMGLSKDPEVLTLDAGVSFTMLIKDMGYASRIGDTYYEKWNIDESSFTSESKSLICDSMVTSIADINPRIRYDMNWMVGFNQVSRLTDASTSDLSSNTINGRIVSNKKCGKNVIHLSDTRTILENTGVIYDNNDKLFCYNEVVDSKYIDGKKVQPDFVIFATSSNEKSKFSKYVQERYNVALEVAKNMKLPLVVIDLDKVLKHQKDEVDRLIEIYKKNNDLSILNEILKRIRMNRMTDYGRDVFNDSFLSEFLVDIYDESNDMQMKIIRDNLDNMVDYSLKDFEVTMKNRNNKIRGLMDNSKHKRIIDARNYDDILDYVSLEIKENIEKLEKSIADIEKKFFKF